MLRVLVRSYCELPWPHSCAITAPPPPPLLAHLRSNAVVALPVAVELISLLTYDPSPQRSAFFGEVRRILETSAAGAEETCAMAVALCRTLTSRCGQADAVQAMATELMQSLQGRCLFFAVLPFALPSPTPLSHSSTAPRRTEM